MRHRVVIEAVVRTADGGGGASETWASVADVWAAIRPTSGDERLAGEAISGHVSHAIHIRHRDGVVPAMRIRHGLRLFEILAVIDVDERRRRLLCLCRERDL
jgi:SPP1 family predicted phage head-tail adaptor